MLVSSSVRTKDVSRSAQKLSVNLVSSNGRIEYLLWDFLYTPERLLLNKRKFPQML